MQNIATKQVNDTNLMPNLATIDKNVATSHFQVIQYRITSFWWGSDRFSLLWSLLHHFVALI